MLSTLLRCSMHNPRTPVLQRCLSSLRQSERDGINSWIKAQRLPAKQPPSLDHITPARLEALCCTLPTLDGSIPNPPHRSPADFSKNGTALSPGHHLIFCNPPVPERKLNSDATSSLLVPPTPLTRRMWAGGKFEFKRPIRVGNDVIAQASVSKIEAKRLDSDYPMVIVEQTIEMKVAGSLEENDLDSGCLVETRSHVYLPIVNEPRVTVRIVKDLPKPDFSLSYTPTDTTLFRFSALTFNAHRIHLYKDYAQTVERLPERLVHGPMTALMSLETIEHNRPESSAIYSFEYRATNPLFVNQRITIHGSWLSKDELKVWAQSDDGVVGMVGEARLRR